jgi:hypothetical protein
LRIKSQVLQSLINAFRVKTWILERLQGLGVADGATTLTEEDDVEIPPWDLIEQHGDTPMGLKRTTWRYPHGT